MADVWTAGTTNSAGYEAHNVADYLFSNDPGERWAGTTFGAGPDYVQVQHDSARTHLHYFVSPGGFSANQNPSAWNLKGSNDGSSWTTLDARTGQTFADTRGAYYTVATPGSYTYYRLEITALAGGSGQIPSIAELLWFDGAERVERPFNFPHKYAMGSHGGPVTLARKAKVTVAGTVDAVHSYTTATSGTANARVYNAAGTLVASGSLTLSGTVTGHIDIPLGTPISPTVDEYYQYEAYTPTGHSRSGSLVAETYDHIVFDTNAYYNYADAKATTGGGNLYYSGPRFTPSGAGSPVTGSGSSTAPVSTSAGSGTVSAPAVTGAGASTAPTSTSAGAGTVTPPPVTGSGASVAPASTSSGAGTVAGAGVTGSGASVAPGSTSSGAGTFTPATVTGAAASVAPGSTSSGAGTVSTPPSSTPVLPAVSVRAPGGRAVEGQVGRDTDVPVMPAVSVRTAGGRPILQPIAPPVGVLTEWPIRRVAHVMAALSEANPRYTPHVDYTVDDVEEGRLHVWVNGQDITYLRGVPALFEDFASSAPFNATDATISLPQLKPWDVPGVGDLAALDMGRDPAVEIKLVKADESMVHLWEGYGATDGAASGQGREDYTFQCEGLFMQAANEPWEPPLFMEPRDRGHIVADVLNSVTARRWSTIPRFTTGLTTTYRGDTGQSKWAYVQQLLSFCYDDNGRQLTLRRVAPYTYRLVWKELPTDLNATFTVTKGAPGVEVSLRVDQSTRRDAIYGRGVDPDGGMWGNWFFPFLDLYVPPPYPYNDTSRNIEVGDTDADTDTGNGVTLWQRRMRELGYRVSEDGVMHVHGEKWIRQIQKARGILVDGSLGPQTWAATFDQGAPAADLRAVRLPLAALDAVEPYLYTASGAVAGANPAWDSSKIRHAMPEVDFGTGIWKRDAEPLAEKMLARDAVPADVGTITLMTDPHEAGTSRFEIQPGDNIKVVGHRGGTAVQVVDVAVNGVAVTLTVDSKARDTLALEAILERNRDARRDPSSRPGRNIDTASLNTSEVVPYESESKAGRYPRTAINGDSGLWTVLPIFVSQLGVAKVEFTASSPKAELVVALWERSVTANYVAAKIGNPLVSSDGWFDNIDELRDDHGLMEVYGSAASPGGYWPRQKDSGPLTGKLRDTSGALYGSRYGGVVWVAVFASRSTWVTGRVYPAGPSR